MNIKRVERAVQGIRERLEQELQYLNAELPEEERTIKLEKRAERRERRARRKHRRVILRERQIKRYARGTMRVMLRRTLRSDRRIHDLEEFIRQTQDAFRDRENQKIHLTKKLLGTIEEMTTVLDEEYVPTLSDAAARNAALHTLLRLNNEKKALEREIMNIEAQLLFLLHRMEYAESKLPRAIRRKRRLLRREQEQLPQEEQLAEEREAEIELAA